MPKFEVSMRRVFQGAKQSAVIIVTADDLHKAEKTAIEMSEQDLIEFKDEPVDFEIVDTPKSSNLKLNTQAWVVVVDEKRTTREPKMWEK